MVKPTRLVGYGIAAAAVTVATLLRFALYPFLAYRYPFALYVLAVTFTAWYAGLVPALLTLGLGAAAVKFVFAPPAGSPAFAETVDNVRLLFYLSIGFTTPLLIEAQALAKQSA